MCSLVCGCAQAECLRDPKRRFRVDWVGGNGRFDQWLDFEVPLAATRQVFPFSEVADEAHAGDVALADGALAGAFVADEVSGVGGVLGGLEDLAVAQDGRLL